MCFSEDSIMQIAGCVGTVHKAREVLVVIRLVGGRQINRVV